MPLTEKQEKLVIENINLIHHFIKKYVGIAPSNPKYEDLASAGKIGLVYAAKNFDESRGNKFSTYAIICIKSSIFKEYRSDRRHNVDYTSLDAPIVSSAADKEDTLEFFIEDPNSDFSIDIFDDMDLEEILKLILNFDFKTKRRESFLLHLAGLKQDEISEFLKISQPQVCRELKSIISIIQKSINLKLQYEEVYEVSVEKERYKISFSSRDVPNFNLIFSTLMEDMVGITQYNKQSSDKKDADEYPTFKVSCNNERIVIMLPRFAESFIFLAKIINKINNYSIHYIASDGNRVSEEEAKALKKEDLKQISCDETKKECKNDNNVDRYEAEIQVDSDTEKSQNENIVEKDDEIFSEDVCFEGISLDEEIKTYLNEDSILSAIMKFILMQKEDFTVQDIIDNFANEGIGVYVATKAIAMLNSYVQCVKTDKPKIYRVVRENQKDI
ncbi:MAG: sigma-70 family RNA polymerase sigma factor [Clostridia bacterium]|nr:sigma-70 family RNA polymerase sigma factor [Clostridia bacterium]